MILESTEILNEQLLYPNICLATSITSVKTACFAQLISVTRTKLQIRFS